MALDFDGERRPAFGSSYATAWWMALAVSRSFLAGHPEWTTTQLKADVSTEAQANEVAMSP